MDVKNPEDAACTQSTCRRPISWFLWNLHRIRCELVELMGLSSSCGEQEICVRAKCPEDENRRKPPGSKPREVPQMPLKFHWRRTQTRDKFFSEQRWKRCRTGDPVREPYSPQAGSNVEMPCARKVCSHEVRRDVLISLDEGPITKYSTMISPPSVVTRAPDMSTRRRELKPSRRLVTLEELGGGCALLSNHRP